MNQPHLPRPPAKFSLALLFVCFLVMAGCSKNEVLVMDPAGLPIAGAQVEPVSLSINYPPVTTDSHGKAKWKSKPQRVEWINVSKPGYEPQRLDRPSRWPLKVILIPQKTP